MSEVNNTAWYRKYRPKTMDDYLGESIRQIVKNRFTREDARPSVMMIYGTRGCGKTTFARIISKYYLCEHTKEDGSPCEECDVCLSINETLINGETGVETPGVVEVDATTANGKEAIQNIIEDAIIPPTYTKKKLLILDECHMITAQAQNSLLKIIEDIPPHLVVIFATTDPEKVLGTVHSRCQLKLEVKKQSIDDMASRLLQIATYEGVTTSREALKIIAKKGDRVPRECINLLESIAKNYGNQVTISNVRASLKDIASEVYINFYEAANSSIENILLFNNKLKEMDITPKMFISGLSRFTLDCLYVRHSINLEDYPLEFVGQVKKLFNYYTTADFDTLLQVLESAVKVIDDDEAKGELLVTTTAMRIGKIQLLARGLGNEAIEAEKENKKSIIEYKKIAEKEREEQNNKDTSFSPSKEAFARIFNNMSEVKGTVGLDVEVSDDSENNDNEQGFDHKAFEEMFKRQ